MAYYYFFPAVIHLSVCKLILFLPCPFYKLPKIKTISIIIIFFHTITNYDIAECILEVASRVRFDDDIIKGTISVMLCRYNLASIQFGRSSQLK